MRKTNGKTQAKARASPAGRRSKRKAAAAAQQLRSAPLLAEIPILLELDC